ncbi:hypothetical protein QP794_08865 [Paenibacillus sp. UMB7766-LJ446]|uniref:Uncharacterized protein n=1 Tax=Paenibacillus vandeheii TaxID=3035917 RepID=A0ABT8JEQ6_9BACL|nr:MULTISPECIES: hypothetical protein [Paenibacillus]EAQ6393014.1 hypothetical protein [Salmonella enterica]OPG97182.1 hypothetical protein B2I21_14955 [Chryseobacterium mucoviscidosis]ECF8727478.1 hypothetical protein [Salmonella enterica]MDK8190194.1 hypothetical protein [Paenibacillus sp. UMB7766-LJ446]MDN4603590.1 hypothetical protein [Paenibacillus vandeheii]
MIKPLLFTYLGVVVAVIIMDFKHLKQAAAINRWLSYGLIVISAGIWFYVTHLSKTVFVTTWLTHLIQRWLPLP